MLTATRLSRLLRSEDAARLDRPVGVDASGAVLTFRGFLAAVGLWRDAVLELPEERRRSAVLYDEDAVMLAPALFGLWAAGVHVVLPGDLLPGTLEHLERAGVKLDETVLALEAAGLAGGGRAARLSGLEAHAETLNNLPVPTDLPLLDDRAGLVSLLTSGSTGEAKLVRKRLEQAFWEPESIDAGLAGGTAALGPIEVIGTVSAQHIYGLLFRVLWPLMSDNAVIAGPRLHFPESLAAALAGAKARRRRAAVVAAPAHLKRFTDPALFSDVRDVVAVVFSSTGPLDEAGARHAAAALGHFPIEVLGSTETGGIAWRRRSPSADGTLTTPPWRPVEGITAAVRTDSGDVHTEGEGLVTLSGRHLERAGWIDGSDRIRLDADGFTLLGRADRIVKIEGKRVSLPEVEAAVEKTGLVGRVRVLPLPEATAAGTRETLAAVAEASPRCRGLLFGEGKAALVRRLRGLLKENLPAMAIPRRWRFVDELPANAQGKTTARALTALFDPRRPEWLVECDEKTAKGRRLTLRFEASPTLRWFEGHFPGLPILPGVAQLLLVEQGIREFVPEAEGLAPRTVKQLKFRAVTKPGMKLRLVIDLPHGFAAAGGTVRFEWRSLEEEESVQSSGAADWAAVDPT